MVEFHGKMYLLISALLEGMPEIEHLELDMRNMNELLQMKKLKDKIISGVRKSDRSDKSFMSMMKNKAPDNDEKQLRLNIVM